MVKMHVYAYAHLGRVGIIYSNVEEVPCNRFKLIYLIGLIVLATYSTLGKKLVSKLYQFSPLFRM